MGTTIDNNRERRILPIDSWKCPEWNGVSLFGAPTKPRGLIGIDSKSIYGERKYKSFERSMRRGAKCKCAICGEILAKKRDKCIWELCDIDRYQRTMWFKRFIILCPLCYDAVNMRQTHWLNGAKYGKYTDDYVMKVVRHCFSKIAWFRGVGYDDVRVDYAFLQYAQSEDLRRKINRAADFYDIKFIDLRGGSSWHDWKYVFGGREYLSPSCDSVEQWQNIWFTPSRDGATWTLKTSGVPKIGFSKEGRGVILYDVSVDQWNMGMSFMRRKGWSLDVKTVDRWECVEDKGAPLLTMPNVPRALHGKGMQPRTIFGDETWGYMRKQCLVRSGYRSEVSGICPADGGLQVHELFRYDYLQQEGVFVRCVALTGMEHDFIHSGRMVTLYKEGAARYTKEYVLSVIENGFRIINEYNKANPGQQPLRVYTSILSLLETELHDEVEELIMKYDISFYQERIEKSKLWKGWHVIVGTNRYDTPYSNERDWKEAMKKASASDPERN